MSDISKLSGHLRAIRDMAIRLHDEALANGDHPEMPGGEALASLADVADRDVWERRVALREDAGDYDTQDELDDAQWPPLQTLWFWTDDLREQTGITVDDPAWRPTIASEAAFLANPDVLQWLWSNEPRWDDLVADVRRVRTRLEDVLTDGMRADRLRVVCPDCDAGKRLIRVWGKSEEEDRWKCPACKALFAADDVTKARAKQLRSQGAARWVPLADAISVMLTQGWREKAVREWFTRDDVEVRDEGGRREAWWPDVWRIHREALACRAKAERDKQERAERRRDCVERHGDGCWDHDGRRLPGQPGCRHAAMVSA